jgi:hypothetical protein
MQIGVIGVESAREGKFLYHRVVLILVKCGIGPDFIEGGRAVGWSAFSRSDWGVGESCYGDERGADG